MKSDGRLVTDAGEVEIARGVEHGGLELELLLPGSEHGYQVGLARFVGLFEAFALLADGGEEGVPHLSGE